VEQSQKATGKLTALPVFGNGWRQVRRSLFYAGTQLTNGKFKKTQKQKTVATLIKS
jgi:hypothetical protein